MDLAKAAGIDDVGSDVSSVIAYAVQQRLKNLLERLGLIAEHRMEVIRVSSIAGHKVSEPPPPFPPTGSLCSTPSGPATCVVNTMFYKQLKVFTCMN
jgi:hypothetical protein